MNKILVSKNMSFSWVDYPENDVCITIYVKGCEHNCKGCHSVGLQNFELDDMTIYATADETVEFIEETNNGSRKVKNVVIMGGEPLHPRNIEVVKDITRSLYLKGYNVCIYTGSTVENIDFNNDLPKHAKYVKIGRYDENLKQTSQKTDEFFMLASKNQKVYKSDDYLIRPTWTCVSNDGVVKFKN